MWSARGIGSILRLRTTVFPRSFHQAGGNAIEDITCSDAFLTYVEIFSYELVKNQTEGQMQKGLEKIWNEFLLLSHGSEIELVDKPEDVEHTSHKLINWFLPFTNVSLTTLKIGFVHAKTTETSSWTYGHELGRMYLEKAFDGRLETMAFEQADTEEDTEAAIQKAIAAGCNLIFTTAPQMINQSVKAAIEHPEVKIFNCSVNLSYSSVCTYYGKMYKSKFLMGAVAQPCQNQINWGISRLPDLWNHCQYQCFCTGGKDDEPQHKSLPGLV